MTTQLIYLYFQRFKLFIKWRNHFFFASKLSFFHFKLVNLLIFIFKFLFKLPHLTFKFCNFSIILPSYLLYNLIMILLYHLIDLFKVTLHHIRHPLQVIINPSYILPNLINPSHLPNHTFNIIGISRVHERSLYIHNCLDYQLQLIVITCWDTVIFQDFRDSLVKFQEGVWK